MAREAENKHLEAPDGPAGRTAPACRPSTGAARVVAAAAFCVNILLIIAAMFAAFEMLPGNASASLLTFLTWYIGFFAIVWVPKTLARAATPRDERRTSCQRDHGFPRLHIAVRLLWRGLPVALLIGGHYELAGLVALVVGLAIAGGVEDRRIRGEIEAVNPVSRAIHSAVFGLCGFVAPVTRPVMRLMTRKIGDTPLFMYAIGIVIVPLVLVIGIPILVASIPFHVHKSLMRRTRKFRLERKLVKAMRAEGKLAWFAYAEPHEREHFLGEGGVLHEVAGRVIARDWRRDLQARAHSDGVDGGEDDLDGVILSRLRLSNMRDDLPVLVFFEADNRMKVVRVNRAYRGRLRDGGDLLAKLEEGMRLNLERAALPA